MCVVASRMGSLPGLDIRCKWYWTMISFDAIIMYNLYFSSSEFFDSMVNVIYTFQKFVRASPRTGKFWNFSRLNNEVLKKNVFALFVCGAMYAFVVQIVATALPNSSAASNKFISLAESFFFLRDPIEDISCCHGRRRAIH